MDNKDSNLLGLGTNKPLLRPDEAAKILSVSRYTVYRLVNEILSRGGSIEVVPGPTAAMTALAISGLSADKVMFLGFLPKKAGKRNENWKAVKEMMGITVIIYESPYRVKQTLEEIQTEFGSETLVVIARELTKEYEQIIRGKVSDVLTGLKPIKGEVVILFRS